MKLTKMDDGRWLLEFSGGTAVLTAVQYDQLTEQLSGGDDADLVARQRTRIGYLEAAWHSEGMRHGNTREDLELLRGENRGLKAQLVRSCSSRDDEIKRLGAKVDDLIELNQRLDQDRCGQIEESQAQRARHLAENKELRAANEALAARVDAPLRVHVREWLPSADELAERYRAAGYTSPLAAAQRALRLIRDAQAAKRAAA